MKKILLMVFLGCFSLFLIAQEKVQFEGTVRIHKQQENIALKRQQEATKKALENYASQKDFGDKLIMKAVMKSANKETDRVLAQSGAADGEFDIIKKMKENKVVEFIPALGKITIYDGDATDKIEVYTKYKVAVKTPFLTEIPKIYKVSNPVLEDTVTVNGILCKKVDEHIFSSVFYLTNNVNNVVVDTNISLFIHQAIDNDDLKMTEDVIDIIEESVPDDFFKVPASYKFVEQQDVVKLQMKDKKGIVTSYKFGDPIPANFWNFK